MKIIEVKINIEVPDGHEFVKVGHAEYGDLISNMGQNSRSCKESVFKKWIFDEPSDDRYFIFKKIDVSWWPENLVCPFVAQDANNKWYGYSRKPVLGGCTWDGPSYSVEEQLIRIDFPEVNWKNSLFANPHNKA